MIKTTSFAPPRPPRKQRQSVRASGSPVSENRIATVRSPQSGTSRPDAKILTSVRRSAAPDSTTIPVPAKSVKSKSAKITASQEMTLDFDFEVSAPASPAVKAVEAPVVSKTRTAKTKVAAPSPTAKVVTPQPNEPQVVVSEVAVAKAVKAVVAEATNEAMEPAPKKKATPKSKRVRVPENLAEQYGAKLSKRVESGITDVPAEDTPKKRLNKAEREARKQLLRPDEGLIERLQRAANLIPAKKVAKPRGWKFDCGRCGRTTYFQTPNADICVCGAIAVKD